MLRWRQELAYNVQSGLLDILRAVYKRYQRQSEFRGSVHRRERKNFHKPQHLFLLSRGASPPIHHEVIATVPRTGGTFDELHAILNGRRLASCRNCSHRQISIHSARDCNGPPVIELWWSTPAYVLTPAVRCVQSLVSAMSSVDVHIC
jgi:hypothetical protein